MSYSFRDIWKISFPIIAGLIAQNIMVVIDTAFLGRVSEVTLGAAAIGGVFYLCLVMLGTGFAVGAQIIIGRQNGNGKQHEIGAVFDNSLYILIVLSVILWALLKFAAPVLLNHFISSEAVLNESLRFLEVRKYGLFFGFIVLGFNALYIGSTRTKVLTFSTAIMATCNIILDYLLIFGNYGFPEMGIAGAALATNIAEFATFIFYLGWVILKKDHFRYKLFVFSKPSKGFYQKLLNLSVPVMFQYFLSFAAWFVFFLIIEQIGETELAASNITRSIYMVLMIPVWGLSMSVNTLVSNTIGMGRTDLVIPLVRRILVLGLICNFLVIQLLIFLPMPLISFYTDNPDLMATTIPLLRVISIALIAFAFGMILFNGLSGTGKTLLALKIEILSIAIYLLTALMLATVWKADVVRVWMVEVVYFIILGIMALGALKQGRWKELKL